MILLCVWNNKDLAGAARMKNKQITQCSQQQQHVKLVFAQTTMTRPDCNGETGRLKCGRSTLLFLIKKILPSD